jgi:hypothetical protein
LRLAIVGRLLVGFVGFEDNNFLDRLALRRFGSFNEPVLLLRVIYDHFIFICWPVLPHSHSLQNPVGLEWERHVFDLTLLHSVIGTENLIFVATADPIPKLVLVGT